MEDIRKLLKSRAVKFQFQKVDGSVRVAYGTTNVDLIDSDHKDQAMELSEHDLTYFDLDKCQWRSIAKDLQSSVVVID